MAQLVHGSARTTAAVRRAIPPRQARIAALAARDDVTPTTVATGKQRAVVQDAPRGPTPPRSTVLTQAADARMVVFRTPTLLPLDDGRSALQATLPPLPRSAWPRCWRRPGICRLSEGAGDQPQKKTFHC
jgi:hypothetical protein